MNKQLNKRIKSFLWRAGGMTTIAVLAIVVNSGDIYSVDYKDLLSFGIVTFLGLVAGEITKYLNRNAG